MSVVGGLCPKLKIKIKIYGIRKKNKFGNLLLKNYKMGFKKPTHGKMGRAGGVVIERN